jgi:hypothetical protein
MFAPVMMWGDSPVGEGVFRRRDAPTRKMEYGPEEPMLVVSLALR